MSAQCVFKQEQPENMNKQFFCRLCLDFINYTDSVIIQDFVKGVLLFVLPNLNLEEGHNLMCKVCCSKLFAAFNFKLACIGTEDIICTRINEGNMSVIELKEVYLKVKGNIQSTDIVENQRICRLCLQLVTYGFVPLKEMDNDIINTYIPQIKISATRDPIICGPCFDSLCTHGSFARNCLEALEKYKSTDIQPYIKTEVIDIKVEDDYDIQGTCEDIDNSSDFKSEDIELKLEDDHDMCEQYENIDNQVYIKSEAIETKSEEGDQDNDSSYNLNEKTIEDRTNNISEDTGEAKANKCEIPLSGSYKNRYKRMFDGDLKRNVDPDLNYSEAQMYKCDTCAFETKNKYYLKNHQLTHKDPSKVQMYKCGACDYETAFKHGLKKHQLVHKKEPDILMYKCDACSYVTKYKNCLKIHEVAHKDSCELEMYTCEICTYQTPSTKLMEKHQFTHKDPSEIEMYKCDTCTYETKYKKHLKDHKLSHKDPLEIQKYICNVCAFVSVSRGGLNKHRVTHNVRM